MSGSDRPLASKAVSVGLVAIDLDGTMVDSVPDLHAAITRMLEHLQFEPASPHQVSDWVGHGIERLVHRALTRSCSDDASPELFNRAMPQFLDAYEAVNGTRSALYPGVVDGLEWLATLGIPLVMITNKSRRFALPLLHKLAIAEYFDLCLAGDDVARKKPDPQALLQAASQFGIEPASCLMLGDSMVDIAAGRAAGFHMIAVSYGYNRGDVPVDPQSQMAAHAVVDSLSELSLMISATDQ